MVFSDNSDVVVNYIATGCQLHSKDEDFFRRHGVESNFDVDVVEISSITCVLIQSYNLGAVCRCLPPCSSPNTIVQ